MINSFAHPRLGFCSLRRGPSPRYLVRSPNGHCYMPIQDDADLVRYLSGLIDPCAVQVLFVDSCRFVSPFVNHCQSRMSGESTRAAEESRRSPLRVRVCVRAKMKATENKER